MDGFRCSCISERGPAVVAMAAAAGAVLGALTLTWALRTAERLARSDTLGGLKDGLLALALGRLRSGDFDASVDYGAFDGSRLPMMSGCDPVAGCLAYLDRRRCSGNKTRAIDRYLARNFNTAEKADAFLREFMIDVFEPSACDDADDDSASEHDGHTTDGSASEPDKED
jgi:hypothetical protein